MRSSDRPWRLARLTTGAVLAAALALAGCSSGGDWPRSGVASASPGAPASVPAADTAASGAADGGGSPGAAGGAASGGGGGATGPGGGDNPSRCRTAELKGSLGPADGAAGSVNQTLILTNVGSRTCYLRGFPGVSYVGGEQGAQVGPSAAMAGPRGVDIRLDAGGSAGAALKLVNVQNYDPAVCRPTPVRGLRVYPPGDTASLFVPRAGTGCAGTPPGDQITVRALTAR